MPVCENCGNDYDKTIEVIKNDKHYQFDCFECAIMTLAPTCATCGTRIIGHGVENGEHFYCCAHCAKRAGAQQAEDHPS